MLARIALVLPGLVLPAAAFAAEAETRAIANAYSIMLERQLYSWRIWTTGVSRLDRAGPVATYSHLAANGRPGPQPHRQGTP